MRNQRKKRLKVKSLNNIQNPTINLVGFFYAFYLDKSINRLNCNRFIFRIFAIMKSFFDVYTNIMALTPRKAVEVAIQTIDSEYVTELNKEQLFDGEFSDGTPTPDYSPHTIEKKKKSGGFISSNGRIAFRDKGDFFRKMGVKKQKTQLKLFSKDEKSNMLIEEFGEDIFGLNEENKQLIIEDEFPKFIDEIQKLIFK